MNARAPKSRLLTRLDAAMAKARNPIDAACLRAERAGFLARYGQFDEAQAEFDALHAQFDSRPNASVSAWLCIAEGWHLHFSRKRQTLGDGLGALNHQSPGVRDKIKRGQALSAAAGLTQLHALAAAWLAHMDYAAGDIDGLVRNVSLALGQAAPDNHAARACAGMAMALGYDFAGRLDRAQAWYARAREHALADGDETAQSALNHGISAHRVRRAMQAAVFGGDVPEQARQALAGLDCASNFDAWVGTVAQNAPVPMQRACIASVSGQYEQALALYEKHLADVQQQGFVGPASHYLADMAWCRWQAGDHAGAQRDAHAAATGIDTAMPLDDRAVAHGRLGLLFKLLDEAEAAALHDTMGRECREAHGKFQEDVALALDRVPQP